jgi:nucleoside phosphorylase
MQSKMRILVVEDSDEKYASIHTQLRTRLTELSIEWTRAREYSEAITASSHSAFDLVLLDLLIPAGNATPDVANSRSIIHAVSSSACMAPTHIIGLTEFANYATEEREYFDTNMFALEVFSFNDTAWAEKIASKIRYLAKSKSASLRFHFNNFASDLLIVCARHANEFSPIVDAITWEGLPSTSSEFFPNNGIATGEMRIGGNLIQGTVICVEEAGLSSAAVTTANAIGVYRPRIVAMLGMCCGFGDKSCVSPSVIGDIIVVRETACWEEGKFEDDKASDAKFLNRAVIKSMDGHLKPLVGRKIEDHEKIILPSLRKFFNSKTIQKLLQDIETRPGGPGIKYGMLVSGSSVVASEAVRKEILSRFPQALGLEMEMYAVFTAVERAVGSRPTVIGIKGVADNGDGNKGDKYQKFASKASYLTLKAILADCPDLLRKT